MVNLTKEEIDLLSFLLGVDAKKVATAIMCIVRLEMAYHAEMKSEVVQ